MKRMSRSYNVFMKDSTAELSGDVIKAGTNISVAAMSGDPGQLIGSAISEAVGLTVSAFNALSKKRTDELFGDQVQVQKIVTEIKSQMTLPPWSMMYGLDIISKATVADG